MTLVSYTYNANNGTLKRTTYGGGEYAENVYDNLDRVLGVKYNGVMKYRWSYGADGNVGWHHDIVNGVKWQYQYDIAGNVTGVYGSNGVRYDYTYGTDGSLTGKVLTVGSVSKGTTYGYTPTGTLNQISYGNGGVRSYSYDGFLRTAQTSLRQGNTQVLTTSYAYRPGAESSKTTAMINGVTNAWNGGSRTLTYTYDGNGNIETINEDGAQKAKYYYDKLNQLTREDNVWLGKTIAYTYDKGGNIQTVTEYALTSGALDGLTATKTYSYLYGDSNWKDKLTSYNGRTIAYDAIGNPTTYYDGTTFVWQNGRELAGLTTQNGTGVVYAYDANGIRTRKTVGGVTTYYYTEGGNVVRQTNGTDTLWFYYDEGGSPVSFELNGTSYYYVKNLQGDVIAIVNASGTKLVEYQYDAWGKVTVASGSNANLAAKNPFRYRGYYYDSETGFYYLQSRYYDPQTGRFLNADAYADTGDTVLSTNMFAYCENNPVNGADPSGEDAIWLQDTNAVCGAGHTGLLIQGENGVWYHFYWAANRSGLSGKSGKFKDLVKLNGYSWKGFNKLIQELYNRGLYGEKKGSRIDSYENYIYIFGVFKRSVITGLKLSVSYDLIIRNCMQMSVALLLKGTFSGNKKVKKKIENSLKSVQKKVVPNCAYNNFKKVYHQFFYYRKQ